MNAFPRLRLSLMLWYVLWNSFVFVVLTEPLALNGRTLENAFRGAWKQD